MRPLCISALKLLAIHLIDHWLRDTQGTIRVASEYSIKPFLIVISCQLLSLSKGSLSSNRPLLQSSHLDRAWKRCSNKRIVIPLSMESWWDKLLQANAIMQEKLWAKNTWQIIKELYLKNHSMAACLPNCHRIIKFSPRNPLKNWWRALQPKRRGKRRTT